MDIDEYIRFTFDYITENNKGSKNPYHNTYHLLYVYNYSILLYNRYKEQYKLTEQDKINLSLASLFHDFDHLGNKDIDDKINIKNAISGFLFYINTNNIEMNIDEGKVIDLISSTCYPYNNDEIGILEKILRDADTIGGLTDDWFIVISSLSDEYNITMSKMIENQLKFIDNKKYYLPYSQNILSENKDKIKIKLINLYNNIKNNKYV